jgi:hypothetical protein
MICSKAHQGDAKPPNITFANFHCLSVTGAARITMYRHVISTPQSPFWRHPSPPFRHI